MSRKCPEGAWNVTSFPDVERGSTTAGLTVVGVTAVVGGGLVVGVAWWPPFGAVFGFAGGFPDNWMDAATMAMTAMTANEPVASRRTVA